MSQHPTVANAIKSSTGAIRFDLVAGFTAAAVVLPEAMAYATVVGLPVAVGLYTAFIPIVVYALLGSLGIGIYIYFLYFKYNELLVDLTPLLDDCMDAACGFSQTT